MSQNERPMRRALSCARRGLGLVSPNPMVGAVVFSRSGRWLADGYHAFYGGPHAEAMALEQAGDGARGGSLWLTLEPCCHANKQTSPCLERILASGIRRVVIAMKDPHPSVSGRSIHRMRQAGIAVQVGLLEGEARRLNRGYLSWVRRKRAWIALKAAVSLDGKMTTAAGQSQWITSPAARENGNRLRAEYDAVMVGCRTVLRDNPALTVRSGSNPDFQPAVVVIDPHGHIGPRARLLQTLGRAVWIATSLPQARRLERRLRDQAYILPVPAKRPGQLDLQMLLSYLPQVGIASVLAEGGPRTLAALWDEGFVDEAHLFYAPRLIGGQKAPSLWGGRGVDRLAATPWLEGWRVQRMDQGFYVHGCLQESFKRPAA